MHIERIKENTMTTFIKKLAEKLKQIRTKSESWHTMGIDAGVSAKTLATIVKYPERSYSTRTIEKITEYIRQTENKPEPLSIQDINFLHSQNERLKKQNDSLQEENNKYRQILQDIKGLLQSTLDEFENDDIEQRLCYCQQIAEQILKISEVKDER